jgi:hypothetical protein
MEHTIKTRRLLTLDEFVDVKMALREHLWTLKLKIQQEKERIENSTEKLTSEFHKKTHDQLVVSREKLSVLFNTVSDNGIALWDYIEKSDA